MDATDQARAVAETYAAAWLADDLHGILGCYASDFTLHYFGDNPFTGDHVGKQAALDALLEVEGEEHEIRRALRFRINGSQLSECWLYEENHALIDRAWKGQGSRSTN